MKQIRFFILLALTTIVFGSCRKDNKIPYFFFTKNELNLLWKNADFAVDFQNKLKRTASTESETYNKVDTIQLVNLLDKTLQYTRINELTSFPMLLQNGNVAAVGMAAVVRLMSNEEFPTNQLLILMTKGIDNEIIYRFSFSVEGKFLTTEFSLKDDLIFAKLYNFFTETTEVYLKTHFANYQLNGQEFKDCLIFEVYELEHTEVLKAVYSNEYGFVKFKTNNQEIKIF